MLVDAELITLSQSQLINTDNLEVLIAKEQHIPGSVDFYLRRYLLPEFNQLEAAEQGRIQYKFYGENDKSNLLELEFLISGNKICDDKVCIKCGQNPTTSCTGKFSTLDYFSFKFSTTYLNKFTYQTTIRDFKDKVLSFKYNQSFNRKFSICTKKRNMLNDLLVNSYTGAMHNIFINARIYELLVATMSCISEDEKPAFECKFLTDNSSYEKMYKARDILLESISNPITIKELSRKVATNECYLKKGFKEVFGMTIFEFYQQQRMEHAKYLLYEKGMSVTDASYTLGYSSMSHFSAAFKKHTGMKPCELLQ